MEFRGFVFREFRTKRVWLFTECRVQGGVYGSRLRKFRVYGV